jgi:hypothetical protein
MTIHLSSRALAAGFTIWLMLALPLHAQTAAPQAADQRPPALTNVVPEAAHVTMQATIRTIDLKTREITLQGYSGDLVRMKAGPLVRLELLKAGQRVNAEYYRSIAFFVAPPRASNAAPASDDGVSAAMARKANVPGGAAVMLTKVSGTVVGIDRATNSLQLVAPSGGAVYTVTVTDPQRIAALASLKIGDTVTAVISETLAVKVEAAPKPPY